jgi:S1-C subfamily serine protease
VPYAALISATVGRAVSTESRSTADCGLGLAPVSPVRLPDASGEGRGVLIASVAPESPAAKAGLKMHDVVIRYDQFDIYSPEQLMQLLGNEKAGREVVVTFDRAGKILETKLAVGPTGDALRASASQVTPQSDLPNWFPFSLPQSWRDWFNPALTSFQSVTTRR